MTPVLSHNLARLRQRLALACAEAGRATDAVELLPVTKSVSAALAAELCALGMRDLAENRVDQLERKAGELARGGRHPRWHLIGHLQRNKARRAVRVASVIHSVDSWPLLDTLERVAAKEQREIEVYLELKLSSIEGRTGLTPDELSRVLEAARDLRRVRVSGLMTMAEPAACAREGDVESQTAARAIFRHLRELRDGLSLAQRSQFVEQRVRLSMGMSSDLEAAVHEGADVVRIGSALFADADEARA